MSSRLLTEVDFPPATPRRRLDSWFHLSVDPTGRRALFLSTAKDSGGLGALRSVDLETARFVGRAAPAPASAEHALY